MNPNPPTGWKSDRESPIESVTFESPTYPELLRLIPDPPKVLYYSGDLSICNHSICLAVVGSRKATPYGKWAGYHVARRAAEHGVTIVSGLATGIDSAGHRGALDGGGKTVAVLGCGIDICYPKSNQELRDRILERGLLLSEYEPGSPPLPFQFPLRNRIISGLCRAVVVAEAGLNSGSLITAGYALNQGRDVYGVPGNINSVYSIGANKLIQDGAIPIVVVDDVLNGLGIQNQKVVDSSVANLGKDERQLLTRIEAMGEISIDGLCKALKKPASEVSALVTILEIKGRVQTSMGKIFIAKYR